MQQVFIRMERESGKLMMIQNNQRLEPTLTCIRHLKKQIEKTQEVEDF